ncbi:hypothetical protein [Streptomyces avicenniae]|uniref:hypothetical protein n=1 Tax=Streptomyces avicenniae TaxID=500153 RepID=UPI000699F155|nr:hypothetical protein [Streptomyces avicenniae]
MALDVADRVPQPRADPGDPPEDGPTALPVPRPHGRARARGPAPDARHRAGRPPRDRPVVLHPTKE